MARLGPFGAAPRLAVGVSGGADSMALACLADHWARARGGTILALVADHGLRPAAAGEARRTAARLAGLGILTRRLDLQLEPGPALQARARAARHAALAAAARSAGMVHLLLGHHAQDQAELLAMRARRGPGGAAGMAAVSCRHDVAVLRPLLDVAPERLRDFLLRRGLDWVEDPSNRDPAFERARLRAEGCPAPADLAAQAARLAVRRAAHDAASAETAVFLARHATIRPEGFALVDTASLPPAALGALIRVLGGRIYPPRGTALADLAVGLRPATLGGVEIARAGRLGALWLLCREAAACAPPVPLAPDTVWDGRFRVVDPPHAWRGAAIGPLAADAARLRARSALPARVLRGLPCIRRDDVILAVPHLHGPARALAFAPPMPLAPPPFAPDLPAMSRRSSAAAT